MSKQLHSLALVLMLFLSFSLFSQSETSEQLLHPEVQRYADVLELSEEQTEKLQAIYLATADRADEIDSEMKEARMSKRDNIQNATPSEKEEFRNRMNDLSMERIDLKREREMALEQILTPEQKEILKKSKASRPAND